VSFYTFFENLVDPLPDTPILRPPQRPLAFIWYYVRSIKKLLLITLALSGVAGICEIFLYVFIGYLVDWMSVTEPSGSPCITVIDEVPDQFFTFSKFGSSDQMAKPSLCITSEHEFFPK